jgi:hypothetical protein
MCPPSLKASSTNAAVGISRSVLDEERKAGMALTLVDPWLLINAEETP